MHDRCVIGMMMCRKIAQHLARTKRAAANGDHITAADSKARPAHSRAKLLHENFMKCHKIIIKLTLQQMVAIKQISEQLFYRTHTDAERRA